jgi:acyl-CoA thioester hydrolase
MAQKVARGEDERAGDRYRETHLSFVNTWECDENAHLNVQFYNMRFDEARAFFAAAEIGNFHAGTLRLRNIRYHRELRAGAITAIRSGRVGSGPLAGRIVHLMENAATGTLAATALDLMREPPPAGSETVELPEMAAPRSLTPDEITPLGVDALIAEKGFLSHMRILQPRDCDADGTMLAQTCLAIGSDAAPHVWERSGLGTHGLVERGYGRIAVEMKLALHNPGRAGEAVISVSAPATMSGRTLKLHHEIVRAEDGTPLATLEVVGMLIDLKKRRTLPAERLADLLKKP